MKDPGSQNNNIKNQLRYRIEGGGQEAHPKQELLSVT